MAYGVLTPKMRASLRPFVEGHSVIDLGAGDLKLATTLCELGANVVYAVEPTPTTFPSSDCVDLVQARFERLPQFPPSVVFISWPLPLLRDEVTERIVEVMDTADTVIYLGANYDGTACGTPALFRYFLTREILAHVPDRRNDLIIYGSRLDAPRVPIYPELAGLDRSQVYYSP